MTFPTCSNNINNVYAQYAWTTYDRRFNAREGLVTFPTATAGRGGSGGRQRPFQCPRGLGDFSHMVHVDVSGRPRTEKFQCPRGLGDFSHLLYWGDTGVDGFHTGFNAREGLVTFPTARLSMG